MYDAIKAMFDRVNDGNRQRYAACENREYRNNPLLAVQCLAQYGAGGGKGDWTYHITRFAKIACEKARGEAGYVCDYEIGFNSDNAYMGSVLGPMTAGGTHGQGRFIQYGTGWIFEKVGTD